MRRRTASLLAVGLYLLWVASTYLLEGLPGTLLRPEATGLRLLYAGVANVLVGTVLALWLAQGFARAGLVSAARLGFRRPRHALLSTLAAAALGLGAYAAQGAPSMNPVVVANGFAQVLVVSIAEVLVCWVVLGGGVQAALRDRGRVPGSLALIVVPAALFGLYHFAHSPPFNTPGRVLLLTFVGMVTGIFFLVARDVYGTIVFHNFLALFGVLQAVEQTVGLDGYRRVQWPLIATAVSAVGVLVLLHRRWLGESGQGGS